MQTIKQPMRYFTGGTRLPSLDSPPFFHHWLRSQGAFASAPVSKGQEYPKPSL
jgi:hypothetical protein